jgi:mitochondrial fission protein ELM1
MRSAPQPIVLEVAPGVAPSSKPPVRIFTGTEPGQHRAERVFVWSIHKVRDPSRVYEIHLMKDIAGFDRRLWLTGFTNYRFAIPHWAGKSGRAIYNDVDQVYLSDPAELFDTEMDGHGFLSITARDTSVMLIDCEKMASVWDLEEAKHGRRKPIEEKARHMWGPLDPAWNARDEEYVAGHSKCLHYTTIHSQPWQPFPEVYVYLPNPVGHVWYDLERSADEAAFQVFTADNPSDEFEMLLQRLPPASSSPAPTAGNQPAGLCDVLDNPATKTVLSVTLRGESPAGRKDQSISLFKPSSAQNELDGRTFDAVVCVDDLDIVPVADVPWIVEMLFARARNFVYASVAADGRTRALPDGSAVPTHREDETWWSRHFAQAGSRYPNVRWTLAVHTAGGITRLRRGGRQDGTLPTVWVLIDDKAGHSTQSLGLAQALGWPCVEKKLQFNLLNKLSNQLIGASLLAVDRKRSDALQAPWPDLVISTGRRTAPVARWISKQSRGHSRLIQLGRKGGEVVDGFDLVVSCPYFRQPIHPQRLETVLPLNAVTPRRLNAAAEEWPSLFDGMPRPHVALVVGGDSVMHALSAHTARHLGQEVRAFAEAAGGSVSAITSPRTNAAAVRALESVLDGRHRVDPWRCGSAKNPYLAHLAKADVIVVTGESESMLAEAAASGKPVYIYPLPHKRPKLRARLGNWVVARANTRPRKEKGTVRPQQGLEYICARAIQRGFVRPPRDFDLLHETMIEQRLGHRWGEALTTEGQTPLHEAESVAQRIRELLGYAPPRPETERYRLAG